MPKIAAADGAWLAAAVTALHDGGCDTVAVAMGARVLAPPPGTVRILVPRWHLGLGETVRVAASYAQDRGASSMVLTLVDTPDVDGRVVRRVIQACEDVSSALARAVYDGRPGHPVLIGRTHLPGIVGGVTGDEGARGYLSAHSDILDLVECGDLASGIDHDTK